MAYAHLPCLSVEGFGVAFGPKVVLADLDFGVPALSVTALLGPVGAGKSCLLRSLAGLNFANQRYQEQGRVLYQGHALADGHRPRLAQLNARAMMASTLDALLEHAPARWTQEGMSPRQWCGQYVERMGFPELEQAFDLPTMELSAVQQRALALLREAVCEPALLLVDEPTTDLPDYEAYLLLDLLRILARTSAILLTLDSPRHVQMVAQHVVVLERGRVQEVRTVEDFVLTPHSSAGQQFIGVGAAPAPEPEAAPVVAEAASTFWACPVQEAVAAAAAQEDSGVQGPSGFTWLVPGQLAGTPLPGGGAHSIDHDLAALRSLGVTMLITLTEADLPQEPLHRHGLRNLHLPVYDRESPTVAQIQMLLKRMENLLAQGQVLAVHCLAGIGRTGTVLAAWLVRAGLTASEALRRVRLLDPQYVQSPGQEAFLQHYEETILKKML